MKNGWHPYSRQNPISVKHFDEVVVTSLKSEKAVTSEKSKNLDLLVKESKRVIEKLSPLKIPELASETVSFRIGFVLE